MIFQPSEASKLRGKLGFAAGYYTGRRIKRALRQLIMRQYSSRRKSDWSLNDSLEKALFEIKSEKNNCMFLK